MDVFEMDQEDLTLDRRLETLPSVPTNTFNEQLSDSLQRLLDQFPEDPPPYEDNPSSSIQNSRRNSIPSTQAIHQNNVLSFASSRRNSFKDTWMPEPPYVPPPPAPADFLSPRGIATITYPGDNGKLVSIENLDLDTIKPRSSVIAAAFEASDSRQPQLHLDLLSPKTATPFLRYLYTGSYLETGPYDDIPTSLLLHCQLYFFGVVFDMPDLRTQALVCVIRQCEFACASPEQPIDLCSALRFSYDHVEDCQRVIDQIIDYCIERFYAHKLGKDQKFRSLSYDHRPFYTDLAKACRRRGFVDEAALDIIRLPYDPKTPAYFASREDMSNPRYRDVVQHFGSTDLTEEPRSHKKRKSEDMTESSAKKGKEPCRPTNPPSASLLSLALRSAPLKEEQQVSKVEESSDSAWSEDEGFQIIRSKVLPIRPKNEVSSSPEFSDYVEVSRAASPDVCSLSSNS